MHIDRTGYEHLVAPRTRFSWSVAKRAVDAFLNLVHRHHHTIVRIRFFGGEPLIDWPVYRRVIEYILNKAERPSVDFYLNTNGSLVTSEIASSLKKYAVKTIVSLDGDATANDRFRVYPNKRGTYVAVRKGLEILRNAGVNIHVNVTLNQGNVDCIRSVVDLCKEIGATDIGVDDLCFINGDSDTPCVTLEQQKYAIVNAWQRGKQIGIPVQGSWTGFRSFSDVAMPLSYCAGDGEEICVNHEGKVFPCYGIPQSIGSIDRLGDCFNHPTYQALAHRVVGNIPHCEGCELEGPCGGGCAADAFAITHNVTSILHEKCNMRRAIMRELLQKWALAQEGAL